MARTDNFWDQVGTYIKTIFPNGVDILINGTNKYLNFNTLSGVSGYGFRDNSGVMEYKNSSGAWTAFSAGGGTTEVYEFANVAAFPVTGVAATIYIALDTKSIYHWNGSAYAELTPRETAQSIGTIIANSTNQNTPVDTDRFGYSRTGSSGIVQWFSWLDLKTRLKEYFDTLYATLASVSAKQNNIQFQDEGSNLGATGTVDTVDFVGSGVVASRTGNKVTVTISGGGGGGLTLTEVEFSFGTQRITSKKFTVVDAGVSAGSKILIFPSPTTATGRKGDDWEVDQPHFSAKAASGSFSLNVVSPYRMTGARRVYYAVV